MKTLVFNPVPADTITPDKALGLLFCGKHVLVQVYDGTMKFAFTRGYGTCREFGFTNVDGSCVRGHTGGWEHFINKHSTCKAKFLVFDSAEAAFEYAKKEGLKL